MDSEQCFSLLRMALEATVGDGGCVVGSNDDVNVCLCVLEFRNVVLLPGQVYTEQRGME